MRKEGKTLTHVSLFSGIGGNELAAQWAGFQTVLMCEIDPFCRAVLNKHFPGIPIIEDVHDVTYANFSRLQAAGAELQTAGITGSDARLATNAESGESGEPEAWNGRESVGGRSTQVGQVIADSERLGRQARAGDRIQSAQQITEGQKLNNLCDKRAGISGTRIALLTAGVPCQPASTAGKRRGKADDRWLWPEAIRVLGELQPAWAVFENPAGIISLDEFGGVSELEGSPANPIPGEYAGGLDEIIGQIEERGYEVQTVLIPACAVNAFHRRDRIFIITHTNSTGLQRRGILSERRNERVIGERSLVFNPAIKGLPDWTGGEMGQPSPLTEFATNAEGESGESEQSIVPTGGLSGESGGSNSERQSDKEREIECEFRRLANGLPERLVRPVRNRVSQLKAYGNAVVPEQVYPIFKAIADLENL